MDTFEFVDHVRRSFPADVRVQYEGHAWYIAGWRTNHHHRHGTEIEIDGIRSREPEDGPCRRRHRRPDYPSYPCTCNIRKTITAPIGTQFIEIEKGLFIMDRKFWIVLNDAHNPITSQRFLTEKDAQEAAVEFVRRNGGREAFVAEVSMLIRRTDVVVTKLT